MTINANFPAIRPSLNLDFSNSRALDPRITFSRASSGGYFDANGIYRQAEPNEARFDHDPVTGVCKGLLIEEARTNLLTYSEQFDNAAWGKINATITPNAASAPDGTTTADKLVPSNVTSWCASSVSLAANTTYTLSCFIKAAGYSASSIRFYTDETGFMYGQLYLDTKTIVAYGGATATTLSDVGGGWFRVSVTATTGATVTSAQVQICRDFAQADGTSGIYIWGAQLEAGAFPTSYIPTTSAQATRAADIAQMTGANFSSWYRQDEGTFIATASYNTTTKYSTVFSADDGTSQNTIRVLGWNDGTDRFSINVGNVIQLSKASPNALGRNSYALAYKKDDMAASKNGGATYVDSSGTIPTVSNFYIGKLGSPSFLNGHVARITYYPYRLSNTELQALSA